MNSSSSVRLSTATSNHGSRIPECIARSNEATPVVMKAETVIEVEDEEPIQSDAQLATKYKEDLIGMRGSLTCSICDQLLYEPWTLQCGHTYCYSCLCQWFIPNKRKKTCPECRTAVKQIPAPAFLVKHMVEIFINRGQLMPHDETVEQHNLKNAEETRMVEQDKKGPEGLFRGSFPLRHGELWRDEADGVMRCPSCGHEHEGGPMCDNCGAEFDGIYGFSDMDDDASLSDIDVGYDQDLEQEIEAEIQIGVNGLANIVHRRHNPHHYYEGGPFIGGPSHHFLHHYHAHHHGFDIDDTTDDSEDPTDSDTSNQDNSEDEDAGSLADFVAPDDDDSEPVAPTRRLNQRVVTIISDDEDESEDEGGAITNRRQPRPWTRPSETDSMAIPNSISEDENGSSANGSEFGDDDIQEARMRLRASGGWSPLDEGEDDDTNRVAHDHWDGWTTTEDESATDESDSETIGNPNSDIEDDDNRPRAEFSETPRYSSADLQRFPDATHLGMDGDVTPINYARGGDDASNNYGSENDTSDYDTDGDQSVQPNMDRDGDTEMSVSPVSSRYTRSLSVDSYYSAYLGDANEMAEVDDDSSDTSIRPPPRRQPRQNLFVQQYDPRISRLLAEHQNSVRNTQNLPGLDGWEDEIHNTIRVEPASRGRRRAQYQYQVPSLGNNDARNNHHRIVVPHVFDRARTPRNSPPPRVVPVSSRNNRLQRHQR
ncbi:hypothetical protein SBOR_0706 [Sclerotinia borealis F-4128]|uniref:RING-type domain-containing protein n=1 Tax=Sclerotinia borealis (strain F-4128) TaxID=1432307 RepID=W9CRZ0_SCLBF|nr:hypothetical protein SBOR_0706 [Sclerotinia borealis F-4128]